MKVASLADFADRKGRRWRVIPVRPYFRYSEIHKDTIVISHYAKKTWQKLRKADSKRVQANWRDEKSGNTPL